MSKLSPSLKALINAGFARPNPAPAPVHIRDVYESIARSARQQNIGTRPWLAISAAATFTLNSPDSLVALHGLASSEKPMTQTSSAEFIREVGLKCISFNGIPRTINCLNAFYASLPPNVASELSTEPTRTPTTQNLAAIQSRGQSLWNSIYAPYEVKLYEKLALAHPDLPVHIMNSHYGPLLSDPAERGGLARIGRVLTSVVAISCLRAQTGVAPQVLSHVFGLRKGVEDGTCKTEEDESVVKNAEWLASDDGSEWILNAVDRISEALGGGNFAPGIPQAKL